MSGRYYEQEHFSAYREIRDRRLDQWNDLHQQRSSYDDFPTRPFLERKLPAPQPGSTALVYGCGTGASACYLAEHGYRTTAVDLVPDAIALAREHARDRGIDVAFEVADVCCWGPATQRYDVILDDLCLQSIVTDDDRTRLYAGVGDRLAPAGRYLIATAMYAPDRDYPPDRRDPVTGIVWMPVEQETSDSVAADGRHWLPNRRHLTADALRTELHRSAFVVLDQQAGDVVCSPAPR